MENYCPRDFVTAQRIHHESPEQMKEANCDGKQFILRVDDYNGVITISQLANSERILDFSNPDSKLQFTCHREEEVFGTVP